ncbi:MAG: CNP1-like family protein [Burkholderiales bacterium]
MRFAGAILALLPFAAAAQVLAPQYPGSFKGNFDEDHRPWEEQKAVLPPYPKPENLIKVYVSAATSFDFFVDAMSVSVGQDGVVRYTLVARSRSGAMNVSFEGIRCKSRERKLYAFGRSDNTWLRARDPQWALITGIQANRQRAALADDFFCETGGTARTAEEAVRALRRRGLPLSSGAMDLLNQP